MLSLSEREGSRRVCIADRRAVHRRRQGDFVFAHREAVEAEGSAFADHAVADVHRLCKGAVRLFKGQGVSRLVGDGGSEGEHICRFLDKNAVAHGKGVERYAVDRLGGGGVQRIHARRSRLSAELALAVDIQPFRGAARDAEIGDPSAVRGRGVKLRGVEFAHKSIVKLRGFQSREHHHVRRLRHYIHICQRFAEIVDDCPLGLAEAFLGDELIVRVVRLQRKILEVVLVALVQVGILPDIDLGDRGIPDVLIVLMPHLAQGKGHRLHRLAVLCACGGGMDGAPACKILRLRVLGILRVRMRRVVVDILAVGRHAQIV